MNSDAAPPIDVIEDIEIPEAKGPRSAVRRSRPRPEMKRRVGNYRVVALLGEGGMAQVHLAVKHGPAGFKKLLVVKSMRDELVDPIFTRSFMHEARLAAQLNHPNVVQTYEVGEDGDQLFIAMEYVEGQSMRAVQRRYAPKRLPLNVQLRIIAEVARGLHHAHTLTNFDGTPMKIVHRDVSPQNVMLTYDGQIKLLDFGIAKASGSDELTREGMIKGKIDYMAPEQLRGDAIDQRADVFALGVMLWEALTGMRFSGGAEVAEITKMHNRIMGREQKLRNVAPDTPMRLVEICEKAIALDPLERQETAEEFERSISEYLASSSKMTDAQQLAKIMEVLFKKERESMRAVLEEQLRQMSSGDGMRDDVEVIVVDEGVTSTETPVSSSLLTRSGARAVGGEEEEGEEAPASPWPRIAVASAFVVGALFAALFAVRDRGNAAHAEQAPSAASSASASPTTAAVGAHTVNVHIEAVPADAAAKLDGVPITLPFDAELERDGRLHRIEFEAPGYEPLSRGISLSDDVVTRVAMVPLADDGAQDDRGGRRIGGRPGRAGAPVAEAPPQQVAVQHVAAPSPPPQAPAATPPASAETPRTPPTRRPPIESSNPYEE